VRKKAVLLIVIVVVIGFFNHPIKVKGFFVDKLSLDTDKDVYFNDEVIEINASWELDYDPPLYAYTSIIIFDEINGTRYNIWESSRYDIVGNYSETWLVDIKSLSLSYENSSNILYVVFHFYMNLGGDGSSMWLETIEITAIKRNVSCELIDFDNYVKYGEDFSVKIRFFNNTLHSGYYVDNQEVFFELLLQNFTTIFSNLYITNTTGELEIFVSNIKNLSIGVNYLRFMITNNQFFKSEVFQFEFYFEMKPTSILDLKKDESEKEDGSGLDQIVVISLSLTSIALIGVVLFLHFRNIKNKSRDLSEISFKY